MELDLGAVRAFVAVVDHRHFGEAADRLGVSQQAISKRIAKLESDLDAALLRRTRSGAEASEEGQAFLTYARALLDLSDRAWEAVRRSRRPLRIDVLGTRVSTVGLARSFHEATGIDVEVVTSIGLRSAHPALLQGSIDAAFARVTGALDSRIAHTPAYLEPVYVLMSRKHRLAKRRQLRPTELAGETVWMPRNEPGSEWTEFYDALAAQLSFRIDASGPVFGLEHLLNRVAESTELLTFVGEKTPQAAHLPDVRRIPLTRPTPAYPTSLLWHRDNRHPALPALVDHIRRQYRRPAGEILGLTTAERATFGVDGG